MSNFDFDLLGELIDNAPTAGFGPRVNYGKMTIKSIDVVKWTGPKDARKIQTRPLKKGETVNSDAGEYMQITFNVDIQESNKALEFTYDRRVDVKKSGGNTKTDWSETVLPALVSVIGADWWKKLGGKGVYVEVEDVPTVDVKRRTWTSEDGTEHTRTVPKVTVAYKSKAECEAARAARFAKNEDEEMDTSESAIPENVLNDTRALLTSLGEDQALVILQGNPFGEYDAEELLEAAKKTPF